jgi:hypothetical protein
MKFSATSSRSVASACRGCDDNRVAGILRRLHSHGRTLAESTVEHQAFACCLRQLTQQATFADVLLKLGIRRMQSSQNASVPFALCIFAQIDQHVGLCDQVQRLLRRVCPAASSDVLLMRAVMHVRGNCDVHHRWIGEVQSIHQRDHSGSRYARCAALLAHHSDPVCAVTQRPQPGDMIGVQMRIDRLDQLQVQLAHQLQVAIDLLQHGIDDQCLTAAATRDQVGVGAGNRLKELAEDRCLPPPVPLVIASLVDWVMNRSTRLIA